MTMCGRGERLTVETCVAGGEPVLTGISVDGKASSALHALQVFEAVERHLTCAGDKL